MSKTGKRMVLTDSSVNRYGYRVLTSGITNLEQFKKNPVLLYMHYRDEGYDGSYRAIGHWDDLQIDGDQLTGVPVFDCTDPLSCAVACKYEAGTLNAVSIGFLPIATSEDKADLLPGQQRATVTKWELLEASIVDIPANANAVRLNMTVGSTSQLTAATEGGALELIPELKPAQETTTTETLKTDIRMKFKQTWMSVLQFLGIKPEEAEQTAVGEEQLELLNAEMTRLNAENATLKADGNTASTRLSALESENASLRKQVETLQAAPVPPAAADPAPAAEPQSAQTENLATRLDAALDNHDFAGFCDLLESEGLVNKL